VSPTDFVAKGQALVASGQFQEAVKVCRLGLLGRPTAVEGRIVLGQALLALKRFDEVVAEMRVALDLDPTSMTAQALRGEALIEKGDQPAALEVLKKAKSTAPGDKRITELLSRAEKLAKRSSAAHSAVGFVGAPDSGANKPPSFEPASGGFTKSYPGHGVGDDDDGHFTRPTSISTPGSKKSKPVQAQPMSAARGKPPAGSDMFAVGDKSMTMEADILEEVDDDDFNDLAPPPGQARGAVVKSSSPGAGRQRARGPEQSVVADLASDDMIELDDETGAHNAVPSKGYTAVRNAVQMPSGPLDAMHPPAATRPTSLAQPAVLPPPGLAGMIAQQPHTMQTMAPPPRPFPNAPPSPFTPGVPIASALPTMAAPLPPLPPSNMPSLAPPPHAAAATMMAMPSPQMAAMQQTVAAMPALSPTAAAHEGTMRAEGIDPRIAALVAGAPPPAGVVQNQDAFAMPGAELAQPRRRKRSPLAVFLWIVVGGGVIGGGVFAGFQIRAMRLQKQIGAARSQAVDLAKADTWKGWSGARDRLAGIAQASSTFDNRAALARSRGVLAYEFGDGRAELATALTRLNGQGGADTAIATGYAALDAGEPKAAKVAADAALTAAPNDGAAHYLAGEAAGLAGDDKTAIAELQSAVKLEPRALYVVGLGHAIAQTNAWADALGQLDQALKAAPDHPAAVIEKAFVLVEAGQIIPGTSQATEMKVLLQKLIAEGSEPFATQTRGIAPLQLALANLALAQVELSLGDGKGAQAALTAAAKVGVDDQRFGEEALDTLFRFGALDVAETNAERLVKAFPASRRARITQADILLARGKPADAITALNKSADAAALPRGLAVRGQAKLSLGDLAGARADFEAALKKSPTLEAALVGKAWVALADNDTKTAKATLEPGWNPNSASAAYSVAYASALRRSSDNADREKAKALLEKVIAGPVSLDASRAHLELGRLQLDLGDLSAAKTELQAAVAGGLGDARMELADMQIADRDPQGGHDTLEAALTAAADPPPSLLLAVARARALVGDTAGATKALDLADKSPSVTRWQLDRERGRLALRKGDLPTAAEALTRALDKSDTDRETLLLAADAAGTDLKAQAALAALVRKVAGDRFKESAEEKIVIGKLALADEKAKDALDAYSTAATMLGTKASSARLAQAHFGLAVAAYFLSNESEMSKQIDATLKEDPTLYVAYLFAAQLSDKQPKEAIKFAAKAVQYNPEYVDGWVSFGQLAQRLKRKDDVKTAVAKLTVLAPDRDELKALKAAR
jgi:predicted Zn-dependent protease